MGGTKEALFGKSIDTYAMKKLKNYIEFLVSRVTVSSPAVIFTILLNSRLAQKRIPEKITYDKISKTYCINGQDGKRYFKTKFQNFNSFKNGTQARNQQLIKDYLLENINISASDLIIDCGANIGDMWFALKKQFNNFDYVAFEPSPLEFELLRQNIGVNGISHNIGLWNTAERKTFFISSWNADSSFIKPENYTNKLEIQAKRLDQILDKDIKLFKLEAEGAEMQILEGMGELLSRCQYITADLGPENNGKSTLPEVTNYLLKNNFEMIDFGFPRIVALYKNLSSNFR